MNMTIANRKDDQPPETLSYPRTGKRGVPQQFPRRLYTMLESESKIVDEQTSNSLEPVIQWSSSGQAFHIVDVDNFTSNVLPKYFRTSKFSSFQRNLNLYGFSKVRKGPDTDMYAHPSFLKGRPDLLSLLKKCKHNTATDKKTSDNSKSIRISKPKAGVNQYDLDKQKGCNNVYLVAGSIFVEGGNSPSRVVSPCQSSSSRDSSSSVFRPGFIFNQNVINHNDHYKTIPMMRHISMSSESSASSSGENSTMNEMWSNEESVRVNPSKQGKLGLLALAMECLADADVELSSSN